MNTSELIDRKPKDVVIADFFREQIMAGKLRKGDKLLSDEKIARKYKLNKRTVASGLNSLVEEGLLARAPRRGTIVIRDFVNRDETSTKQVKTERLKKKETVGTSPFGMDHLFFIAETKTLNFVLFEDLPRQRKVWDKLIQDFNSKSKGRKVEPCYIPIHNFQEERKTLIRELEAKGQTVDIIQSVLYNTELSELRDLPEDLLEYTTGDESMSANVLPDFKKYLKRIVPVYTSVPVCVWNQEMADAVGLDSIKQDILDGKLLDVLCSSVSIFPKKVDKTGPHMTNLLRHYGLPTDINAVDQAYFAGFFDKLFSTLSHAYQKDYHKIFIEKPGYDSFAHFSRKKHFLLETLSAPQHFPDPEYIEFKMMTSIYPPVYDIHMDFSALGIAKASHEPEFAADFISFVTTHEAQLFMHNGMNAIPFRKSALNALPESNPLITQAEIDIIYDKIKFAYYPWQRHFNIAFINAGIAGVFQKIVDGEITSSQDAANISYKFFIESFNNMKG